METIEHLIELDFDEPALQTTPIVLNQANYNSVVFNYKLYKGSQEINYGAFSRAEVIFVKRDGLPIAEDAALSSSGISYLLNEHIFDIPDFVKSYINLYTGNTISATLHYRFEIVPDLINRNRVSEVVLEPVNKAVAELLEDINRLRLLSDDEYARFLAFIANLRNLAQSDYDSFKAFLDSLKVETDADLQELFSEISEQVSEFKDVTLEDFQEWWERLKAELSEVDVADLIIRIMDMENQKLDDALEEFPHLVEHTLQHYPFVFALRGYGYGYAPYGGVSGENDEPVESGKYGGEHISTFIRFEWVSASEIRVFLPERLENTSIAKVSENQFVINSDTVSYNIFLR